MGNSPLSITFPSLAWISSSSGSIKSPKSTTSSFKETLVPRSENAFELSFDSAARMAGGANAAPW
eukprot:CAMPEP_0184520692 /NCGR_PEP_ID=MMETSP0198_2-20121128/7309_1 /TAXON_ID=1112570 /ORGANISM="Thraustochytrium sp., Strain LLF1b" /LENGTH=64 /DNA_ID=CAMNT_0026911319 /DNA_START=633 /DNA_END=824 /DNA_ORIENTATION=+